ncbi:Protein FAR1-RELATED SEQUENCE 5 [Hordeum vulgare]|nr:Protein FAR1-RELATED SEQUENCE 5 [Hordeum vulgare]
MDQSMGEMRHGAPSLDLNASGPVCSAHPGESQASMSIAVGEEIHGQDFLDDGTSVEFSARCTEATSGWTRRVRIGKAPVEREMSAARKSALELSVRAYITKRDGNVANPVIGTLFDSIDEAYNFYNLYSWEVGFGIRLSKSRLNVNRSRCMQEIVCGCAGKPVKDNTRSSRCGCNAMIRLLRSEDNGWYICEHRSSHNHPLSMTCGEKMHWQSHRHIDRYTKDLVTQLRQNNVSLGKVFSIVGSFFGCIENVPFTKRALKTLCGKINKEHSDSDARKTMDILSEMKANDPAFNYTVQVDEESRIKTLMWVNGNSIDQYMCFGDAITFDTTYQTNLYDMPIGLFVGVNNHFQSIIFGGAMLRDEKEDTFRWVFREFIRIGGKHPQTIVTDQARSMELAIEAELPNTVHRWCKWHVLKKAKESMGALWGKNSDFKTEFHKLVHHMVNEEEFEGGWAAMLEKYSLKKHPFLTQIYEVRHKWAKPYFRGVFCAKMTRTQRSESANHMLKGYVSLGCPMHLFLRQYEKLQFDRDSQESFQEKRTSLSGVSLRFNLPIERHASKIYTRAMFEQFGEALYKAGAYVVDVVQPMAIYKLTHVDAATRARWSKVEFIVKVNGDKSFFICECGSFEHSGMVMIELRLSRIPTKHILKRWTRDARDILPERLVRYQRDSGPPADNTYMHHTMYIQALDCVRLGDSNVKCFEVFTAMMKEVYKTLLPLSQDKDGMGLEDRETAVDGNTMLDGGGNVLPVPHEASHSSSLATAIDEIAAREEHVYIEEGTGDFDPMVAGVCCAEELVLDDGDNASCVGAVDDKADEDDAESRPTKRAKLFAQK